jgi:uncharacterized OB-fold protein
MATVTGRIVDSLRPLPVPDDLTRPFWDAAKQGRLAIQRCHECRTYQHPPLHQCDNCESRDLRFERVSGRGTIYTFTRLHAVRMKAFEPALPYAVVSVELAEQPWLLLTANMAGTDPEGIAIGAAVQVTFVDIGDGIVLPDFVLAAAEGR